MMSIFHVDFSGAMVGSANQLVTGNVGGALQLWSVDHTHSPPSVSMAKTMEVDGAIFSAAFDSKMELVKAIAKICTQIGHEIFLRNMQNLKLVPKLIMYCNICKVIFVFLPPPGCGWHFIWVSVVHQLV